jgi:hypothetical protein
MVSFKSSSAATIYVLDLLLLLRPHPIASLEAAVKKVTDAGVRNALHSGIKPAAAQTLKSRNGADISSVLIE